MGGTEQLSLSYHDFFCAVVSYNRYNNGPKLLFCNSEIMILLMNNLSFLPSGKLDMTF